MNSELARGLAQALDAIDSAKNMLSLANATDNERMLEEAGDQYEEAREQMSAAMKAIAEDRSA